MKKSKIRILVCLMAAVSCTAAFSVNALAYSEGKTPPKGCPDHPCNCCRNLIITPKVGKPER